MNSIAAVVGRDLCSTFFNKHRLQHYRCPINFSFDLRIVVGEFYVFDNGSLLDVFRHAFYLQRFDHDNRVAGLKNVAVAVFCFHIKRVGGCLRCQYYALVEKL